MADIDAALDAAERAVVLRRDLKGTGFWRAVSEVRRSRELVEPYADRIGRIDRRAFENVVRLRVPLGVGLAGLGVMTGGGVAAIAVAPILEEPLHAIVFLGGVGAVLVGSHSLTHWIVGLALGMRFTHVFLGGPPPPRPGVKLDYATYLRVPARSRAWMHASGAIVSKLVPFAAVPVAAAQDGWSGTVPLLLALGVVQIVTDFLFSTKTSDWKKVKREMRAARGEPEVTPERAPGRT